MSSNIFSIFVHDVMFEVFKKQDNPFMKIVVRIIQPKLQSQNIHKKINVK